MLSSGGQEDDEKLVLFRIEVHPDVDDGDILDYEYCVSGITIKSICKCHL